MLTLSGEQLGYIIAKAREYDAEGAPVDAQPSDGVADEDDHSVLEATADNPTERELAAAIGALNEDQRVELIALMWLGRGDFDKSEWQEALRMARQRHNRRDAQYLSGTPLLADYLEEGAAALGYPMEDIEGRR